MVKSHGVIGSMKPDTDASRALEVAVGRAAGLGLELRGVGGVAEALPFESGSFDAVVSTLVFCSVNDPGKALTEVSRVLRPGGKFLFVEHVWAPEDGHGLLGLHGQQEFLDPLQQAVAGGCHLTRQTGDLIRRAASEGSDVEGGQLFSQLESMERVQLGTRWPCSEQVLGVAIK
ncbi:unnamed protein product [Discosporangium mesarthrocarpum]